MNEPHPDTNQNLLLRPVARGIMIWERLWPLLVPLFIVAAVFLTFSWVGGWRWLAGDPSGILAWGFRLAFAGAAIASLFPLRQFVAPRDEEVTRRIEAKSGLAHRPITAQSDEMATGRQDGFAKVLWEEHRRRMAGQLQNMTAGTPAPKAERFDPFMMRAILPMVVFAAFFFSFSSSGGRLGDVAGVPVAGADVPVRLDAWLDPPDYTRQSPIFLTSEAGGGTGARALVLTRSVSAPEKSEFFLRFIGEGDLSVTVGGVDGEDVLLPKDEATSLSQREYSMVLAGDSVIRLEHEGEKLAEWGVTLEPDIAPKITFSEAPSSALSGSLQLNYTVEDDYGLKEGEARITSRERMDPDARPLVEAPTFPLSLPRVRGGEGSAAMNKDLTEHPWAGSDITLSLEVTDEAGQTGWTTGHEMVLPGRRFSDPLALALVEQRRILALDANQQRYVANLLDAVSNGAPDYIEDPASLIAMRAAYRRLVDARNDDDLRSVLDLLWEIALGVEFGNLSEAEQRLREAQERLSEALENGASDEEIDQLMQELREAMNEMMQALAEQMRQNPQARNPLENENVQTLTQNDLEQMMDRIEDLAKSGSKDAARQMLSELQRMMDNLRSGRHEQQRNAEGNQLNQALDKMSELMQRQQELMDESFRMQRERQQGLQQGENQQQGQQQQGQQQQGQQQPGQQPGGQQQSRQRGGEQGQQGQEGQQGQSGQMTPEEFAEALQQLRQQQEALEQQLGELGQQLEQLGIGQPSELGEAQEQMGQAGENLGNGQPGSAGQNQGNALEALRRGAQNMMEQMAGDRQQGGQQQTENGGQGQSGQQRGSDPLGRDTGTDGLNADSDVEVPGLIDAQRARRILDAIRDRLAIPDNPVIEKDYLERLLETE
ncbi:MAG: TIGR02302 family protein [Pseudomonadota bacterium]